MTRTLMVLMTAGLVLSCSGATAQEDDIYSPKLRIAWDEFKKLYDEKKVVVVDVRGDGAFQSGHIPGARSIPLDDVDERIQELKKLKKPVVTYCAWPNENTSARAALIMQKQGIDARALIGGYAKWTQETAKSK